MLGEPPMIRRAALLLLVLAACSGGQPTTPRDGNGGGEDGPGGNGDAAVDAPSGLVPGTLAVTWMHGSQSCAQNADPEVQVHAYNATTHIIRQNKCRTFEAPFIYVLAGTTLRNTVRGLVGAKPLLAAHSHSHGDHVAGDAQFSGQPMTTVVARTRAAVQAAFGIATWPTSTGTLDLGGRVLDVLAIPGHQAEHIAIYDRQTGLLFTGDTLYPGLLFIPDWATYRTSISRLAQFVATHPISHVLGAHIEMTSTPKVVYPYGTTYQPAEHVLQLSAAHVMELDAALTALGPIPPVAPVAYDDFVISPQ
jgi:glyoxylase-like metal-dependent hydrolase (beta-lactamase superfamily II)